MLQLPWCQMQWQRWGPATGGTYSFRQPALLLSACQVARILHHALFHLLQVAGLKERARAVMDLLHQTPLQSRGAIVQVLRIAAVYSSLLRTNRCCWLCMQ